MVAVDDSMCRKKYLKRKIWVYELMSKLHPVQDDFSQYINMKSWPLLITTDIFGTSDKQDTIETS